MTLISCYPEIFFFSEALVGHNYFLLKITQIYLSEGKLHTSLSRYTVVFFSFGALVEHENLFTQFN